MKLIAALLVLTAVACSQDDLSPPAIQQIHCAGWMTGDPDETVTVLLDGAVWADGSAWLTAEVGINGKISRGQGLVRGRTAIQAGQWTVEYVYHSDYPELNLIHPTHDDFYTAGLCYPEAKDPHVGLR